MKTLLSSNKRTERTYWTRHEERVLTLVYATSTRAELQQIFKTKPERIYQKAFALGLKKEQHVISSQISKAMRNKKRKEK